MKKKSGKNVKVMKSILMILSIIFKFDLAYKFSLKKFLIIFTKLFFILLSSVIVSILTCYILY